jgi:hypothetical protein
MAAAPEGPIRSHKQRRRSTDQLLIVAGMDRGKAAELVDEWLELVPDRDQDGKHYSQLSSGLQALLPDDIGAAGAARSGESRLVLALNDTSVFAVEVEGDEKGAGRVRLRRFPLAADRISLTVVDHKAVERFGRPAHIRNWNLRWASGDQLGFETVVRWVSAFADNGPDSAERFARTLAAKLGWELPADQRRR